MRHPYFVAAIAGSFLTIAVRSTAVVLPAVEKTVVFLFDDRSDHGVGCPNPVSVPCGQQAGCSRIYCPNATGFLTGFPHKDDPKRLTSVLVTAQHVVRDTPPNITLFARFTTGEDESTFTALDRAEWTVPSDPRADVAIYTGKLPIEKTEGIGTGQYATERALKEKNVTLGEPIVTLGLVPSLAGMKRNYPVARQGTLALFDASHDGPGQGFWYFAEAQTYEGNSGGPVFLFLGGLRGAQFSLGYELLLIGINRGYLNQPTQLGIANIGLQAFTRIDVLLGLLCEHKDEFPATADTSICSEHSTPQERSTSTTSANR